MGGGGAGCGGGGVGGVVVVVGGGGGGGGGGGCGGYGFGGGGRVLGSFHEHQVGKSLFLCDTAQALAGGWVVMGLVVMVVVLAVL